jgi:hypothetical protein
VVGITITMPATNYSDLASCNPGTPLGFAEPGNQTDVSVYPNPVIDFLNMEIPGNVDHPVSVRIFNKLELKYIAIKRYTGQKQLISQIIRKEYIT